MTTLVLSPSAASHVQRRVRRAHNSTLYLRWSGTRNKPHVVAEEESRAGRQPTKRC